MLKCFFFNQKYLIAPYFYTLNMSLFIIPNTLNSYDQEYSYHLNSIIIFHILGLFFFLYVFVINGGFEKLWGGGGEWRGAAPEAGSGRGGGSGRPLMVCVVKRLTSALLTKEDVLALNTFFLHELLKITQRPGCTLFRSLPRGASTRCTALTGHRRRPQGPERLPDLIDPLFNLSSEI